MNNIFEKLFLKNSVHTSSLPFNNPLAIKGKKSGDVVELVVKLIKEIGELTDAKHLQDLSDLMFHMIGNNITPPALYPSIPQVYFAVVKEKNQRQGKALILLPEDFVDRFHKNMVFTIGAMVFTGSKIRDFWNDKLMFEQDVTNRARMYESDYLQRIQSLLPAKIFEECEFNEYQKKILEDYPLGMEQMPDLWYEPRPFVVGEMEPSIKKPDPKNN